MKNLLIIVLLLVVGFLAHDLIDENLTGSSERPAVVINGTPVSPAAVAPTSANPVQPWTPFYEAPTYEAPVYVAPTSTPDGVYGPPPPPNYNATVTAFCVHNYENSFCQ